MEMKKKLFSVFNNGSVAWRIFSYSAAVLVFVLAVWTGGAFVYNIVIDNWIRPAFDGRCWGERYISNTVSYQWRYGRRGGTRLCDEASGKVLMRNIDWVAASDDNDSLAVFAKGRKRGYLNRFTGEVVIPTHTTSSMMRQNVSAIMSIRTAPHITTDSWTGRAAGLHRRFTRR